MQKANDFIAEMKRRIERAEDRITRARSDEEYLADLQIIIATQQLIAAFEKEGR